AHVDLHVNAIERDVSACGLLRERIRADVGDFSDARAVDRVVVSIELHARLLSEANEADVSRLYLSLYDQLGVGWNDLQHLIAGAQHGADRRKPYVLHDTLGRRPKLRPAQLIFALLTHLDGRDELLLGLGQLRLQLLHVAVAAIHDLSRELRRLTLEAKDLGAAYVPRLEQ